jgi:hypothetical protein
MALVTAGCAAMSNHLRASYGSTHEQADLGGTLVVWPSA